MTTYQTAYILELHKKCLQQQQIGCTKYCNACPWNVRNDLLISALDDTIKYNMQRLTNHSGV